MTDGMPLLTPPPTLVPPAAGTQLPQERAAVLAALRSRLANASATASVHDPELDLVMPVDASVDVRALAALDRETAVLETPDDACLVRLLVAHKWAAEHAARAHLLSLSWRRSRSPFAFALAPAADAVQDEICCYVSGFDRLGRPILYFKLLRPITDIDRALRLFVAALEAAIIVMPDNIDKICFLFDFSKFGHGSSPPINVVLKSMRFLTSHYPERMAAAYFVNAPWVFHLMWNLIVPFLEASTKAMIHFVKLTDHSAHAAASASEQQQSAAPPNPSELQKAQHEPNNAKQAPPHHKSAFSFANAFSMRRRESQTNVAASASNSTPHQHHGFFHHSHHTASAASLPSSKDENALLKSIDADQLEIAYGGTYNYIYNRMAYAKALWSFCEQRSHHTSDMSSTQTSPKSANLEISPKSVCASAIDSGASDLSACSTHPSEASPVQH